MRVLSSRRFCLSCSPFGRHNTSRRPGRTPSQRTADRRHGWVAYNRRRRESFKAGLVALAGGRCVACGYDASIAALEFHHRDSATKSFELGGFTGSWSRALLELAKCDLVCANCHRERHPSMATGRRGTVEWRRATKRALIQRKGGTCERCRTVPVPAALEFHHRDGALKSFGIAQRGLVRSAARMRAEAAKCDLLCANCHREAHAAARSS